MLFVFPVLVWCCTAAVPRRFGWEGSCGQHVAKLYVASSDLYFMSTNSAGPLFLINLHLDDAMISPHWLINSDSNSEYKKTQMTLFISASVATCVCVKPSPAWNEDPCVRVSATHHVVRVILLAADVPLTGSAALNCGQSIKTKLSWSPFLKPSTVAD